MKLLCAALLLTACALDEDRLPIIPGSGASGTGIPGEPMDATISGRVCMAEDLIIRTPCTATGGLTVSLGDVSTTTFDDGSFVLPVPTGSPLAFTVSGPGAITTTTPYSPSTTIPVVNADVWATMLASNQISVPEGAGSILGTVMRDGAPVSGVTVVADPSGIAGPFYDTDAGFGIDRTGARGVFLVPGITGAASSLAFSPGESNVAGISVINGGVTILDSVTLP
jgi:hypothetical protein